MSQAPLSGLRVLELGHYISAPLAAVFLADQGAEVIRVVRPGADPWDSATEQALARGKRTLEADLKDPAQEARVLALAADCDVVFENFRPGVTDRLGIGYDAIARVNPAVVHVSIPGFSRHDPRADEPAWDATISAATGLFTDLSIGGGLGLPPTYTPLPLPSVYAGLWAATAAAAAVHARTSSGRGDRIETPLMDAAMSAAAGVIFGIEDQPARYNVPTLPSKELDAISLQGLSADEVGAARQQLWENMPAFFRTYACSDGDGLFLCAIDNANQIAKLLHTLEIDPTEVGLHYGDVLERSGSQENLSAYRGPTEPWQALQRRMAERFATDTAAAWQVRLASAGVPAARQTTTKEWTSEPAMRDTGVVLEAPDGTIQPGPQVDVRGHGVATTPPDPRPDSSVPEWHTPRRFAPPPCVDTQAAEPPLAGVRVLDLANVIAGPAGGRALAELGADVLHVSPVAPRMGPRMTLLLGLEVNQGKRSLALDLKTEEGRDVLARLLGDTDIVLYNKLPAQAERLGAAPADVHAVNPNTIVTAVTAYSGLHDGGWEDRPAYDPVVQAATGVMRRFGGDATPAVHGIASCIDYFTGFGAAFGAIVGLLARGNGATHIVARTSLVRTAGWVQLTCLNGDEGPSGLDATGTGPLNRIYRVHGGWVQLSANGSWDDVRARSANAPASLGVAEKWLELQLAELSPPEAVRWAAGLGLTAQEVLDVRRLRREAMRDNEAVLAPDGPSGRVVLDPHPSGEQMWLPKSSWVRSANTTRNRLTPAPRPGEHTRDVLTELGFRDEQIEDLLARGVAATRWCVGPRYVPS